MSNKISFGIVFFLLSLLLKPTWLFDYTSIPISDDLSYWLHANTIAKDFDLNYLVDHTFKNSIFHNITNVPYHPPGGGYLSAIFVFVFGIVDSFINQDFLRTVNQVGSFSYYGYFFSSLFYTLFSFFLLSKILIIKKNTNYKKNILLLAYLSTILHYSSTRFLMAHAQELFLVTVIIYIFESQKSIKIRSCYLLILMYFLLSITRPLTFVISLVLIFYYFEKFNFKKNETLGIMIFLGIALFLYFYLSNKLYLSNSILLNLSQNSTTSSFVEDINFSILYIGIIKIPNLLFSFSAGLLWTAPIIFLGIILTFYNHITEKNIFKTFIASIYIFGFIIVALFWQGGEIAYGQRLFVGLIPFSIIQLGDFTSRFNIRLFLNLLIINSYLNYLYFYSSENLTLKEGKTLWGTIVRFSAENYTINLYSEIFNVSNILNIFAKSIYSINLFGLFDYQTIFKILSNFNLSSNKLDILQAKAITYFDLNYGYIFLVSITYLVFLYIFLKIILVSSDKN